jgi:hypothetical protein
MSNAEILLLVKVGIIRPYALEKVLADPERGVLIRRRFLNKPVFKSVPYEGYDFSVASRACCENIIGRVRSENRINQTRNAEKKFGSFI